MSNAGAMLMLEEKKEDYPKQEMLKTFAERLTTDKKRINERN